MPAQELTKTDEEKMVDLDVSGPAVDVELPQEGAVITEVGEEPSVEVEEEKLVVVEETQAEEKQEELQDYGKKVQKRIDKLTAKLREAERREHAATKFAESVKKENEGLKTKNTTLDGNYIVEFANRITTETEAAKEQLRQATQNDEIDRQVEAQQKLARLAVEAQNLKNLNEQRKAQADKAPSPATLDQVFENNVANETPAPPDPKAEAWAAKNDWFGKDAAMTMTSFVHHRQLTEEEGFDGTEDEYYDEIDKRMKAEFPHKFDEGTSVVETNKRPAQTVASATRSPKRGRGKNTVRLTPSQVAIAKKLGVPLEEYAKHVKE